MSERTTPSPYIALDSSLPAKSSRREFFTWLESLTHEDARELGYDTVYIPHSKPKEEPTSTSTSTSTCSCSIM